VNKKYGVNGGVFCETYTSQAEAEQHRRQRIDNAGRTRTQIVETEWPSAPPASTAPTPAVSPGQTITNHNLTTPNAAPQSPAGSLYDVCYTQGNGATAYLSGVFENAKPDVAPVTLAFRNFLEQKYGYEDPAYCNVIANLPDAKSFWQGRFSLLSTNKKVIDTGWSFGAASAVPVSPLTLPKSAVQPSPAPTAAGSAVYVVCWTESDANISYLGVPFDGTKGAGGLWEPAFRKFLFEKYGSRAYASCSQKLSSLAEAERFLQKTKDRLSPTHKLVETGWKYE